MGTAARISIVVGCMGLAACGSCSACGKDKDTSNNTNNSDPTASTTTPSGSSTTTAVAELLPRCRGEATRIPIPGEDVVVGDVAIGPSGLLIGIIHNSTAQPDEKSKRVLSVIRASLDLTSSKTIDVGPAIGDDPPPSPRFHGDTAYVAYLARQATDGGTKLRALRVARLEEAALAKVEATVLQQADESTAFDIAWNESGAALAAWDEDAPPKEDASAHPTTEEGRGFVKIQVLGSEARRIASPESSDAESPRLLARPGGGFWLAWLARRAEDEAYSVEGPGEKRAFRWVELVALDAQGAAAGPVRRVSSDKGRAVSFELARASSSPNADLVVMVQDEAASSEGGGSRIVRHLVSSDNKEKISSVDVVVDGGVGHALAELIPVGTATSSIDAGSRWLAWSDTAERAHMTPLGAGLLASSRPTAEPSLDGARVLAAVPPDAIYALVGASPSDSKEGTGNVAAHPELRRFVCK